MSSHNDDVESGSKGKGKGRKGKGTGRKGELGDPRPELVIGAYMQTKGGRTRIRCKGYTRPPGCGGHYIGTMRPGTTVGPIEDIQESEGFSTILEDGWWINVWARDWWGKGTQYAWIGLP